MQVLIEISALGGKSTPQVVYIAAVRFETKLLNRRSSFSSFVRPEDLTLVDWRSDEYLQSIQADVLDAKPLDLVFSKLIHWLSGDDEIFCWNDMTRIIFQKQCRNKGLPEYNIRTIREGVITHLNDDHRKKGNPIKLCSVRGYGISGSCYDAEKVLHAEILLVRMIGMDLEQIGCFVPVSDAKTRIRTTDKTDNTDKIGIPVTFPLVYSKTSHRKTVHRRGCACLRNITEEKKGFFTDMRSARLAGYHPCSCCSPIRKLFSAEKKKLLNYSRPHDLSITYYDDAVHIQSRFDIWQAVYDDAEQKLLLLHKNNNPVFHMSKHTPVPGFHDQKCDATTLKGILRTVVKHDDFREDQDKREKMQNLKPKAARKVKKKDRKRKIRRTISLIDALKASGQL